MAHKAPCLSRAKGWFGQKADEAEDAVEDSKDYLSRKSRGARDEADHQASKARGWFGQKADEAEDAAEDTKGYLSRKSRGARDEADHQAGKARGWFGQKADEAEDAAEDTKGYLSRKSSNARDEADHQAGKAKGWFSQKTDEAENAASRGSREAEHQGRSVPSQDCACTAASVTSGLKPEPPWVLDCAIRWTHSGCLPMAMALDHAQASHCTAAALVSSLKLQEHSA